MKPFRNLAETLTPDGSRLSLHEHDGDYFIKLNGRQLMSSTSTTSEILLAQEACQNLGRSPQRRVLIGGLGLGFSLKRVLEMIGKIGVVHVAELIPEVIDWNRKLLAAVNGELLKDRRVEVFAEDVFALLRRAAKAPYDAILLDVDNGPTSFVQAKNSRIYSRRGLRAIWDALTPGGRVAFWSAEPEPGFTEQLSHAGFLPEEYPAKAHERAKRFAHMIYVGERT
jgi:spermidine synthase